MFAVKSPLERAGCRLKAGPAVVKLTPVPLVGRAESLPAAAAVMKMPVPPDPMAFRTR